MKNTETVKVRKVGLVKNMATINNQIQSTYKQGSTSHGIQRRIDG